AHVGIALDMVGNEGEITSCQLARQRFHFRIMHRGNLVVIRPILDGRSMVNELEAALGPAWQRGRPAVVNVDLDLPSAFQSAGVFRIHAGGTYRAPDVWHSDVTWRPEPSLGSILRAVELPPLGGDTRWGDMGKAYDLLDDEAKERIDGLKATHDFTAAFGRGKSPEVQERMRAEHPTVEHPVVRTHPETGRKTLFV